ncbi:MAG: aspartate aminotransferase family protein [Gemmatimonadetes bacterium]|nr:aspartate aminotransferase family protein [Gemmatimonadota bacterium]
MNANAVRQKQREFLFPCITTYYEDPLVLVEGRGCVVKDAEGRDYLDFFGGILTVSLEHGQPDVVDAVKAQVEKMTHVSTLYVTEPQVRVAERLARLTPGKLKKSFFTNSGTEADETAILLAKIYTGQQEIIVLRHGYSGRSLLATNLTGHAGWRPLPSLVPGIKHALSPYCYRCPLGLTYPSCGVKCAQDIEELIRTETNGRPAAFLAEPIQGVGGFITPPREYFEIAVGIVRKYGGVFICDEVQTGFGRTGDHWFGIEHWGVEPEIMTMAKGIANGLPVGATVATPEVADAWKALTISTFGGNPVTMAAADATLRVMERENVPKRAAQRGAQLRAHLEALREKFPIIGEVRGLGLMQGVELVEDRDTREPATQRTVALLEAAKRRGLLIGKGGLYGNVLRIAPPMLISAAEVDEGARLLEESLAAVSAGVPSRA